jgi:hypothetical protein
VVLSEPLNGDFHEGIIVGRMESQARSEASSMWGINAERERHRVSPKTTPIRPPDILPPLTEGLPMIADSNRAWFGEVLTCWFQEVLLRGKPGMLELFIPG